MRNFIDKVFNLMGGNYDEEYYEDAYDDDRVDDYEPSAFERLNERRSSKVVKLRESSSQMRVVVIQPQSYEEAETITNHLKSRKPIVVNLESVEKNVARRIIDFLSGAVCALDGDIRKIANGIFLIAPDNVDIMSDAARSEAKTAFPWN